MFNYKTKKPFTKRFLSFCAKAFALLFLLGALGASLGGLLFVYYTKDFPRPEKFNEKNLAQSTKILDRTGKTVLYELYGEEKRSWIALDKMPDFLKQMAIAAEDADFYNHIGVDFKGILRAIYVDFQIGQPAYGGSTIPQQLIRSTFLTNEKTAERKIREIIMAIELDRRYSKDQILEWYLNQVPFGRNSYGIEAASQTYFGKSVSEISEPEAATLIALIQAPSRHSENYESLFNRKDYILSRMAELGYMDDVKSEELKKAEVEFLEKKLEIKAPYFTLWVKKLLEDEYGLKYLQEAGYSVYTSIDLDIQSVAEKSVQEGIKKNYAYNAFNASLVATDPKTGEILAMTLGSGNYYEEPYPEGCKSGVDCLFDPQYNVAVENPGRQPGSAFKPFVYATAFEKGYSDQTIVADEPTCFGKWGGKNYCPQNFDGRFRGPVTLRQALAQSLNIPAVKVLNSLAGLEDSIAKAKEMGITTLNNPDMFYGLSLVLGGGEVKLIDMVSAYGCFAAEGLKHPLVPILKIEDHNGNIVFESKKTPYRVLSSRTAYLISSILSDNNARASVFGVNSPLFFPGYNVACKTGTTSDYKDGWIIGYTPSITTGVWVGNNNNKPLKKEPGVVVAGPIFHDFMNQVLPKYPKEKFTPPY